LHSAGWPIGGNGSNSTAESSNVILNALYAITGAPSDILYDKANATISASDLFLRYQSVKLDHFSPVVFQAAKNGTKKLASGQAYALVYTNFIETAQK